MQFRRFLLPAVVMLVATAAYGLPAIINNVPDWTQPATYGDFIPPQDPPPGGVANWCTAVAGANVMGYLEDVLGHNGLGDGVAFPTSTVYPNNDTDAGAPDQLQDYLQGQWHDGCIEMGYYMDTQGWRTRNAHFGTTFGAGKMDCPGGIGSYLQQYSLHQWTVWNYDTFNGANPQNSWNDYLGGQSAPTLPPLAAVPSNGVLWGDPVLVTLDYWVDPNNPFRHEDASGTMWYDWSCNTPGAHTVTGVGYAWGWDPDDAGPLPNGNWMICHDGWTNTPQHVAVPWNVTMDSIWWANTHIDLVPEPASALVLLLAAAGVVRRRTRRR